MSRKTGARFRGKHPQGCRASRAKAKLIGLTAIGALLDVDAMDAKTHAFQEIKAREISERILIALELLRVGPIQVRHMEHLADAGNMALILAEMRLGFEYVPTIKIAQEALADMLRTSDRVNRTFSASPEQWAALSEMVDIHRGQLDSPHLTDALVQRAEAMILARKRCGDAYSVGPTKAPAKAREPAISAG